jgi:hypothetical protein
MIEFIFVDLLTLPFNIFVWVLKYFGSLLFWVALVSYLWSVRSQLGDWLSDKFTSFSDRLRRSKKDTDTLNDIDDYIL